MYVGVGVMKGYTRMTINVMFRRLIRCCVELTVMSKNTTAVKYSIEVFKNSCVEKMVEQL